MLCRIQVLRLWVQLLQKRKPCVKAIQGAMNSPLLNDNDIRGAKRILLNISSGTEQVTIDEITEINQYIQDVAKDTDIIFGTCDDLTLENKLSVTLIATGFEGTAKPTFTQPQIALFTSCTKNQKYKK